MQVKGLYLFNIKKRRLRVSVCLRLNSSVVQERARRRNAAWLSVVEQEVKNSLL